MSPRSSLGLGCGSRIKYLVVWSKVVEVSITVTIQYLIWVKAVRRKLSVLTPSSFTLGQAWRSTLFEREGVGVMGLVQDIPQMSLMLTNVTKIGSGYITA